MSESGIHHLFVYGSLRSGFKSPAYEYMSRFFRLVGDGKVRGKMYDLGPYPAGIPAEEDSYIIGELYAIQDESEFAWAIGQLDDYEGMNVEAGEQPLYWRELADVFIEDRKVTSWIYWYKGDVTGKPMVASGDILEYIKSK